MGTRSKFYWFVYVGDLEISRIFIAWARKRVVTMTVTVNRSNLLANTSLVTTLIDAIMEFSKGRREAGLLLLVAAAVSSRVPGFGTAVSVLLRAYRRLRSR